jgi:hypothetical protein
MRAAKARSSDEGIKPEVFALTPISQGAKYAKTVFASQFRHCEERSDVAIQRYSPFLVEKAAGYREKVWIASRLRLSQ